MPNRLIDATSPYLLQHADNPVDWWPWCDEAFDEARRRDVPVLLSVGYAACHWCHVMAHESFEDEATAAALNAGFVSIKVDREERPDVDAVYMQVTQALSGQGGWPMTVFLTPDREPFYAGTYFPPRPGHGLPSFPQLLEAIGDAWRDRRTEVVDSAAGIARQLAQARPERLAGEVTGSDLDAALAALIAAHDDRHGGFGGAPKFPPSMVLEALLRMRSPRADAIAGRTLEAMARGGIYDQLAGGFARYSVDTRWVVPHFEKMLYDNALLLGVYTHWWRRTEHPLARQVVEQTVDWLLAELRTPQGAFAASLDADSLDADGHSHEGAAYVWTPEQLRDVLGADCGRWAAEVCAVTETGTFEHGTSTLQRVGDPDPARWAEVRARLLEVRRRRQQPGRDDKVVAAWNGWLIASLVEAAAVLDRDDWLDAAFRAAEHLWAVQWIAGADAGSGRLRRTSRDGRAGTAAGVLEDYAALAQAAVRLAAALGDRRWLDRAVELVEVIVEQFDDSRGGFYDTAADAERLITRLQDPTDNATPSGTSAAVHALRAVADLTGDDQWAQRADQAAAGVGELVRQAPRFAGWLLADAVTRLREPAVQVAVVGDPDDPRTRALQRTAHRLAPAGSVVLVGRTDQDGFALLADRPLRGGLPTAYVCRHFVCRLPVTTEQDLARELAGQVG